MHHFATSMSTDLDASGSPRPQHLDVILSHGRRSLWDRESWAITRLEDKVVVEPWRDEHQASTSFFLIPGLNVCSYTNVTELWLQLDDPRNPASHSHLLYAPNYSVVPDDFPNTATEKQVVQLCQYFPHLASLTVRMCKPELAMPHIPLLVYKLAHRYPKLGTIVIEDTHCHELLERVITEYSMVSELTAITEEEERKREKYSYDMSNLHTLEIHKPSLAPWAEEYDEHVAGFTRKLGAGANIEGAGWHSQYERAEDLDNDQTVSMACEARLLAWKMLVGPSFPSLRHIRIVLYEGPGRARFKLDAIKWGAQLPEPDDTLFSHGVLDSCPPSAVPQQMSTELVHFQPVIWQCDTDAVAHFIISSSGESADSTERVTNTHCPREHERPRDGHGYVCSPESPHLPMSPQKVKTFEAMEPQIVDSNNIMSLPREPLWLAEAWAFKVLNRGRSLVIERWQTRASIRKPLDLVQGIREGKFSSVTHLTLTLDSLNEREYHGHSLYQSGFAVSIGRPLNAATEVQVVDLCRYLRRTVVNLTIKMCKPELIVPHIPRLVRDVVESCPGLKYFTISDIQCQELDECAPIGERMEYCESELRTLAIMKRSAALGKDAFMEHILKMPDPFNLKEAVTSQERFWRPEHFDLHQRGNMVREATSLAGLMIRTFPSLRHAHVVLGREQRLHFHMMRSCEPTNQLP
ncbi:hypothetical protein BV20DRAFT_980149 [Pilatotrama ljubarskyi]|nr:hypothetical protein BV20DRAFT_980149 [Pilatotrama ljubarskyi]